MWQCISTAESTFLHMPQRRLPAAAVPGQALCGGTRSPSSDHLEILEPSNITLLPLNKSSELELLIILLSFVQEQWVVMVRCTLTVPWAPATRLINVRTAQSGEHQNSAVVRIAPHWLWPGWNFTGDWSQSSCNPVSRGTKWGPLSSPGPQQAAPSISLWVECLSEPSNS